MALIDNQVSYYKCDTDGSFPDAHGSNNGTISGAAYTASGKINGAYDFDGLNDEVDTSTKFGFGTGNFTVNFWFKSANNSNYECVLGQWTGAGTGTKAWYFRKNTDGRITICVYTGGGNNSTTTTNVMCDNTWKMITFTRVSGVESIYVDGVFDNSNNYTATDLSSLVADFTIGVMDTASVPSWYYEGSLDEIGIWDRGLNSTEVTELYNSGVGMTIVNGAFVSGDTLAATTLAYWTLDNTLADATENGNTLTNNGAVYNPNGVINGAYDWDTANDYMYVANVFAPTTPNTISMWLDVDWEYDSPPNSAIRLFDAHSGQDYLLLFYLDKVWITAANTSLTTSIDPASWWDTSNPMHIVIAFDSGDTKFYVNGDLKETLTTTFTPSGFSGLTIGNREEHTQQSVQGVIDEIGIWNKKLTQTDVTNLYNSGAGLQYPFLITPSAGMNIFGIEMLKVNRVTFTKMNGV